MTSEPAHSSGQSEIKAPSTPEKEMVPSRSSGFSLTDVRQEMDKLWESVMSGRFPRLASLHQVPPIDVMEKDGRVVVRADLPGLREDEVMVEVDPDGIIISGERHEEHETKDENYFRSERTYGKFVRRIQMPARADLEKASATFRNGVLEIEMPMRPEPEKKKIEIRS